MGWLRLASFGVGAAVVMAFATGVGAGAQTGANGDRLWQQAQARYKAGDHRGAAELTRQAATAGNLTATYEMGYMYENGDGVARDMKQALDWFSKGAARGSRDCDNAVGGFYEAGDAGLTPDFEKAGEYYFKAASLGNDEGSYSLARLYEYGLGVPLNLAQAVAWYQQAAKQGNAKATGRANDLLHLYLEFDSSYASDEEQRLFVDEGVRLVPKGKVFHSMAERMAYMRQHAGVKKDRQAAAELQRLDNEAIRAQQKRNAEEQERIRRMNPIDGQEATRRAYGISIYNQSHPDMNGPFIHR